MNVVFDFAGVVFHWHPMDFLARMLPQHAPDEAAAQSLYHTFFENWQGDWGEFDRGAVEPGPLAQRIARRTGIALADTRRVIDAVPHELEPIAGTVELLHRLHAQRRPMYFLSNMPAPYADHLDATHAFLGLFRDGVYSARANLCKPEPAIFEHCAQRFGIAPDETLFFDDMPGNIEAARAAGWNGVQFVDAAQCAEVLREHGLLDA